MKIVILTTKTPHHIYYVREVSKYYNISGIAVEKYGLKPPFDIHHPFEDERDEYEVNHLLDDKKESFDDYSKTLIFDNVNNNDCFNYISNLEPEIIITFGTGLIKKPLIEICPSGFLNLHGGDPQYYRGLDSHLWAIYHKDFSQLKVTLHRLNSVLDDGDLVEQALININKQSKLHELRSENTKICVDLTISALNKFYDKLNFESKAQKKVGRYYSFMPSVLKNICLVNFNKYVDSL